MPVLCDCLPVAPPTYCSSTGTPHVLHMRSSHNALLLEGHHSVSAWPLHSEFAKWASLLSSVVWQCLCVAHVKPKTEAKSWKSMKSSGLVKFDLQYIVLDINGELLKNSNLPTVRWIKEILYLKLKLILTWTLKPRITNLEFVWQRRRETRSVFIRINSNLLSSYCFIKNAVTHNKPKHLVDRELMSN